MKNNSSVRQILIVYFCNSKEIARNKMEEATNNIFLITLEDISDIEVKIKKKKDEIKKKKDELEDLEDLLLEKQEAQQKWQQMLTNGMKENRSLTDIMDDLCQTFSEKKTALKPGPEFTTSDSYSDTQGCKQDDSDNELAELECDEYLFY